MVAGVVTAIRTKRPYNPSDSQTSPAAIRNLLTSTAEDLGTTGYDYQYGYGVVDGCEIVQKIVPTKPPVIDLCRRFPWICDRRWWRRILRRRTLESITMPAGPGDLSTWAEGLRGPEEVMSLVGHLMPEAIEGDPSPEQLAYQVGYWLGQQDAGDQDQAETDNSDYAE